MNSSKNHNNLNVYAHNNRTLKYMKQNLIKLKSKIDKFTIAIRYFNTPLSIIDATTRQKINRDIEDVKNSINNLT